MRKNLPPLNNLNTFSITAKYLSFSRAADELAITQSAVSQQIRLLEQRLGFQLFYRLHKKLRLSPEGEILEKSVSSALDNIKDTLNILYKDELSGVLTISTLPSLAMKWLIPRLADFNQKYPEINVHIHANVELTDFKTEADDMAIRFGHRSQPDIYERFLMPEEIFLVASPKLLKGKYPLKKPSDLKHHTLLHDEIDCHYELYGVARETTWKDFAALLKVDISKNKNLTFTQAHLVLQAAVEGQGVAIARSALVADDLKTGLLVRIYPDKIIKSPGYHIVYPKTYTKRKKIKLFEKWLLTQV